MHQIFSFPLFSIVLPTDDGAIPAIVETDAGPSLMLFTTREKAEELQVSHPESEVFEIVNESDAIEKTGQLPVIDAVILDPKDGRGFVMLIQDFIESIQPQSHELN